MDSNITPIKAVETKAFSVMALFDRIPDAVKFVQEVRGLIADLKEVYRMRQFNGGLHNAETKKDTTDVENMFRGSGNPDAASK